MSETIGEDLLDIGLYWEWDFQRETWRAFQVGEEREEEAEGSGCAKALRQEK